MRSPSPQNARNSGLRGSNQPPPSVSFVGQGRITWPASSDRGSASRFPQTPASRHHARTGRDPAAHWHAGPNAHGIQPASRQQLHDMPADDWQTSENPLSGRANGTLGMHPSPDSARRPKSRPRRQTESRAFLGHTDQEANHDLSSGSASRSPLHSPGRRSPLLEKIRSPTLLISLYVIVRAPRTIFPDSRSNFTESTYRLPENRVFSTLPTHSPRRKTSKWT